MTADWDREPDDRDESGDREGTGPEEAPPAQPVLPPSAPYFFRPGEVPPIPAGGPHAEGTDPLPGPDARPDAAPPSAPIDWPARPAEPPRRARAVDAPSAWSRVGEELVAWFKTLVSAAVYATLIVTFGFQVARVEGLSMAPTLEDQDRLIVNKLAYRLHDPQVGDIVMLYYPLDPDKSFVKRIVAEPGDSIRSVRGRVYRNDVPLDDDFIPEEYRSEDSWGPETVPDGYYFVMGDHRNNSSDSRTWKHVPKKYIIGKVQLRWWPIDEMRMF